MKYKQYITQGGDSIDLNIIKGEKESEETKKRHEFIKQSQERNKRNMK